MRVDVVVLSTFFSLLVDTASELVKRKVLKAN